MHRVVSESKTMSRLAPDRRELSQLDSRLTSADTETMTREIVHDRDSNVPPWSTDKCAKIAVVIPSYKSEATIVTCLDSLVNQQTEVPFSVHVLLSGVSKVDNALRSRFPNYHLIYRKERWFPGKARNYLVRNADAPIIAFTDADCVLESSWIDDIARAFDRIDADAIGGSVCNGNPFKILSWPPHFLEFSTVLSSSQPSDLRFLASCNFACYKKIFVSAGGFPEDLFPSEDTLFNESLRVAGKRLVYSSEVKVKHCPDRGLVNSIAHSYRLGQSYRRACLRTKLPGSALLRFPWPIAFIALVPGRYVKIAARVVITNPLMALTFVLTSPLLLLHLIAWFFGFYVFARNFHNTSLRHSEDRV